jgi:hypothetical protein
MTERQRREKCEEKMLHAEYELQAKEKAEALRVAEQYRKADGETRLAEEKLLRKQVEHELAEIRETLHKLAQELC